MTTNSTETLNKMEQDSQARINQMALQVVYTAREQENHSFLTGDATMRVTAAWDDDNDVPMHLAGFPVDDSPMAFNVNFSEDGKSVLSVHYQDDEPLDAEQAIELLTLLVQESQNIAELSPDFN